MVSRVSIKTEFPFPGKGLLSDQVETTSNKMNELDRLCEMLHLLPEIFTTSDHIPAGRPIHIERDVQRMQQVCTY